MLSLLAQVLDSFIDLYSDETKPTEKVFQSKNFLDVLRPTLPKLQGLVRSQHALSSLLCFLCWR